MKFGPTQGKVKSQLGIKALYRELEHVDGTYALRESGEAYRGQFDGKNEALRPENTLSWRRITELAGTYRGPTRHISTDFTNLSSTGPNGT